MKKLRSLSQSIMALVLLSVSLSAHAQDLSRLGETSLEHGQITGDIHRGQGHGRIPGPISPYPGHYCSQYSPYDCDQVPGCQYSRIYSQCVESTGPGRPQPPSSNPAFCSNYHYDQFGCQQVGCIFDFRSNACLATHQPSPRPIPGPGPRPVYGHACIAVDSGFEEHRGGHQGLGRTQYEAAAQALANCHSHHGECRVLRCSVQ